MLFRLTLCAALASSAAGYASAGVRSAVGASRSAAVSMGAPSIVAQKQEIVDGLKAKLDDTMLIFCARSEGMPVNTMNAIRQKMPEGTTIQCTKNTIVRRAIAEDDRFPEDENLLQRSNYWFFVPEADVRATVETWNKFIDETNLEDNAIVGGMFEGQVLDAAGIEAVTKLPTKQELMGTTAA